MKANIKPNPLFITEQLQYLDHSHVYMCDRKAQQKLAVNEHEMQRAGFAWTNCGVASGRGTL